MENKKELLECAFSNFSKFGSKRFSMDELAHDLGISKKTIYKHFQSKEELVMESLQCFLRKVRSTIDDHMQESPNEDQPLLTIVYIYKLGLGHLQGISPAFFYGLNKYYYKAAQVYSEFREDLVWNVVHPLLVKAQKLGQIRPNVNVELVCKLFLLRLEDTVYSKANLFDEYSAQELLDHVIINNLRGVLTLEYLQNCPYESY